MKMNEQTEKEIATRLGLTKPKAPADVSAYIKDGEEFRDALDKYERPSFSWRASKEEAKATIYKARKDLTILEELIDKLENHSETVILATTAYYQANQDYWNAIEREESKPRNAFKVAKDEFVSLMEKEKRSLKRKQNKSDWQTEEYREITTRLELVEYMASEARYLDYDPETAPTFSEQVLWLQIAKADYRANAFLAFVSKSQELAN